MAGHPRRTKFAKFLPPFPLYSNWIYVSREYRYQRTPFALFSALSPLSVSCSTFSPAEKIYSFRFASRERKRGKVGGIHRSCRDKSRLWSNERKVRLPFRDEKRKEKRKRKAPGPSLFSLSFRFIDGGIREIYRPGAINSTEMKEEHRVHSRLISKEPSDDFRRTCENSLSKRGRVASAGSALKIRSEDLSSVASFLWILYWTSSLKICGSRKLWICLSKMDVIKHSDEPEKFLSLFYILYKRGFL